MAHSFNWGTTADEAVQEFHERVRGRNILVTGPSPGGIGEATVLSLARGHPKTLILVGRTPTKLLPVVVAVHALSPDVDVRTYAIDLSSMGSVRAGALAIGRDAKADGGFGHIDVLINNAGTSIDGPQQKSVDGIELHFATNHLGPWLLTNMLMQLLKKSEEPRVVSLTSGAHRLGLKAGDYSDYNFEKRDYAWFQAYGESKLTTFHFTRYLSKCASLSARNLVAFSVHPGLIWGTGLVQGYAEDTLTNIKAYVATTGAQEKSLQQGAATTIVAALDPALAAQNGAFLFDCAVGEPFCEDAKREDLEESLWRLSETLVGETFAY